MSLFNVSIKQTLKRDNKELLDSLYAQLLKNQNCESIKGNNSFEIQKCKLNTILRFNTKVTLDSKEVQVDAELHDTLLLTILVVLAILLTYGIGVILIVVFAYLQKRKAEAYLKDIIKNKNF
ncbi:hypothetical protein CRV01_01530 [Arcobacter sp. CECT 8983]|uniref:hypothetical protein n=1 Tax=Arcobacter sp. CECT 8983 TaxID=2044508 RepID=UPI00100AA248|nr:hypothetical protein [Arcobacter sp. CECT 8983]RXJ91799.1 hypothetical protein CRV01_01530 [Arcobacter sp. CECT 8983]